MTFERYDTSHPMPGELLEQALRLLETSFPEAERRETPEQHALMKAGALSAWAALDDTGGLAALMTLWPLEGALFLEHFAVDPRLRGAGLGGRMLEALKAHSDTRLVLEAEPPISDWARRRLDFYARHGLTAEADFPYFQPPYRAGGENVPLYLLACPAFSSREELERTAREIHRTVYQITR